MFLASAFSRRVVRMALCTDLVRPNTCDQSGRHRVLRYCKLAMVRFVMTSVLVAVEGASSTSTSFALASITSQALCDMVVSYETTTLDNH